MIYGAFQVKIHADQTDRIGIRTVILSQGWQATGDDFSIDALDAQAPATPAAPRGMELIGRERRPWGGGLREYWTYTGVRYNGKDVEIKTYGKSPDYRFEPGFAQVSLLKHPKIAKLLQTYGGAVLDSQIVWPPTVGGGRGPGLGGGGDLAGGHGPAGSLGGGSVTVLGLGVGQGRTTRDNTNPMFGEQDFIRREGTYYYRYVAANLKGLNQQLRVVKAGSLPGYAPSFGDRDYMEMPSEYQRHASFYAITLQAWLSGEGGWNKPIYQGSIF